MIYLDTVGINFLINELKELENKKVTKIEQYEKNVFTLFFNKICLNFIIKQNNAIFYTSKKRDTIDTVSSPFILSLKKHILSSFLVNITNYNNDRIVIFEFSKVNHLGNKDIYKLVFEIRSRNSDILLLNSENKIISNISNSYAMEYKNNIGSTYEFLEKTYDTVYDITEENFSKLFKEVKGISKFSNISTFNELKSYLTEYKACIKDQKLILNQDSNICFNSINEALNYYYDTTNKSSNVVSKQKELEKIVNSKINKNIKIISKIENELETLNKDSSLLDDANLLLIYCNYKEYKNKFFDSIKLFDYSKNKEVLINLDNKLNLKDNANKMFKLYNKRKNSKIILEERKKNLNEEIKYLQNLLYFIETDNSEIGLQEIYDSINPLKKQNKVIKKNNNNKRSLLSFEYLDATIFIGRNSIENEYLTFKLANKNDLWLHVVHFSGSHVIVKNHNNNIEIIKYAANLAAKYSKASKYSSILVDYTLIKYVKKIHSKNIGEVTYTNQKSILVDVK